MDYHTIVADLIEVAVRSRVRVPGTEEQPKAGLVQRLFMAWSYLVPMGETRSRTAMQSVAWPPGRRKLALFQPVFRLFWLRPSQSSFHCVIRRI
jgi:hypothetical protein